MGYRINSVAAFALWSGEQEPILFWVWCILAAVFVSDATITLLRRRLRGEKVYEAHRSHAYQHLARRLSAHRPVTLAYAAVTLCFCVPLAWLALSGSWPVLASMGVAYGVLLPLAFLFRAGASEKLI